MGTVIRRGFGALPGRLKHLADESLHPSGQRGKTGLEVVPDAFSMLGIIKNGLKAADDSLLILWQGVAQPMEGLDDFHGWPSGPIEFARGGLLESEIELAETKRFEAGIRVDDDLGRNGIGQSQIVGGGQAVPILRITPCT